MQHVNVALALHHHQPVGNLPHILEECYQKCYAPILRAIERQPNLKFNLSYSGPLLRFFADAHPEFLEKLQWLVAARQVELLATGFYEPILPEIEEDDRQGQLRLMLEWLDDRLGVTPKGAWLAEGVWDNSLAKTFRQAGLTFTVVRHERMLQAGVAEAQLHGYHVTEHFGHVLRLFPRDPHLHRLMPYGDTGELMSYLRRMANRKLGLTLTFSDDAERWGVWPGSFEKIQQSGAMDQMFAALSDAADWVRPKLFSEVMDSEPPRGRCYIPPGPSAELGMWSLPDESRRRFAWALDNLSQRYDANNFLPFFRAGSWGGFRGRYFESNLMEKKGLWLKRHLTAASLSAGERARARDLLWQAQCNTAYWHGTAGGIYLPHLRQAIWERLLAAQQIILGGAPEWRAEQYDFTADDQLDFLACNERLSFAVNPAYGGCCFEFSLLPEKWNFANTLTRRPETDPALAADGDARENPAAPADACERHLFQERFISRHATAEELRQGRFRDSGDFVCGVYRLVSGAVRGGALEVELERLGTHSVNDVTHSLRVVKTYRWNRDATELRVCYLVKNESALPLSTCFAVELNLGTAPAPDAGSEVSTATGKARKLDAAWREEQCGAVTLTLPRLPALTVSASEPATVWSYPVTSPGETGDQASHIRQGNCFLFGWLLNLPPAGEASRDLTVSVA